MIHKEWVTRQMADKVTGAPITGGDYQLRYALGGEDPIPMTESTDPLYPGRYTSDEECVSGVWAVQVRDGASYVDTGEFITVGAGRAPQGLPGSEEEYAYIDLLMTDFVHAVAFVPPEATLPTLDHIQLAVDYAASQGIRKVYVGVYRGIATWSGAATLDLSAIPGVLLDLGGATLQASTPGIPVVDMDWGWIGNGSIRGAGTGAHAEVNVQAVSGGWDGVLYTNVSFPRDPTPQAGLSCATSQNAGANVRAVYLNCSGHILWDEPEFSTSTRVQTSNLTCQTDPMTGGSFGAHSPISWANVEAETPWGFFQAGMIGDTSEVPDDTAAPFTSGATMGQALKHLFFTQNPKVNTIVADSILRKEAVLLGGGTITMTPLSIWRSGSTVPSSGFYHHLSGESSVNGIDGAGPIAKSGFRSERLYKHGDTKFEKIKIEAIGWFEFEAITELTAPDISTPSLAAWNPNQIEIPVASLPTGTLVDLDDSPITIPRNVWVKASFDFQASSGYVTPYGVFEFNGMCERSTTGEDRLICHFNPGHLMYGPAESHYGWPGKFAPPPDTDMVLKLEIEFVNPARTELPS